MIKSKKRRSAWHVVWMGETTNVNRVLVGKPEEKKLPGRPTGRWKNDIKIIL
jgi:hypothetical protein